MAKSPTLNYNQHNAIPLHNLTINTGISALACPRGSFVIRVVYRWRCFVAVSWRDGAVRFACMSSLLSKQYLAS
jgi:hypothetical protein